jgi:hypothetical protein
MGLCVLIQGIVLIVIGVVYISRPGVFQQVLFKSVELEQRLLTPDQNEVYMWVLGAISIMIGVVLVNGGRFPNWLQ